MNTTDQSFGKERETVIKQLETSLSASYSPNK